MKNLYKRLLTFFVGCTLLVVFIVYGSRYLFVFNTVVLLATILSTIELRSFFKNIPDWKTPTLFTAALLGSVCPLTTMLYIWDTLPDKFLLVLPTLIIMTTIIPYSLAREKTDITTTISNISGRFFLIIYPGFFSMHVSLLGTLGNTQLILTVFILSIYLNDGTAYLMGKLFGNRKRPVIPVSPKKTLVGFICGLSATAIVIGTSALLFPDSFQRSNPVKVLAFSLLVGSSGIIGDLFASALKRSANIKQSGTLIPGRGGMLDSLDSIVLAAPVFYYGYMLFFSL